MWNKNYVYRGRPDEANKELKIMEEKEMNLLKNDAGGIDLMIERDSGNLIRILTGKQEYSVKVWRRLRSLCDRALLELGV